MLQDFILRNGVMSLGGMTFPYAAKTANYTLTDEDYFIDCTSNTFTVTLPTAVGRAGQIYVIKNSGTGTITVATTSAQTIDGVSTKSLIQYMSIVVESTGSDWVVSGATGSQGYQGSTGAGFTFRGAYSSGAQYYVNHVVTYGGSSWICIQTIDGVTPAENTWWTTFAEKGSTGSQGNQGFQGVIGAQGNQGNQGNQGTQGNQGNQGNQGTQGNQGSTGIGDKIYLANNFGGL